MNNGHLPAGPGTPRGGAGGELYMPNGAGHMYGPGPGGPGPRRGNRPPQHYSHPAQQYPQPNHQQMYGGYMTPYAQSYFPPPMHMQSHYPNGNIPPPPNYNPYQQQQHGYGPRSPTAMHPPFAAVVNGSLMQQPFQRPPPPQQMAMSPSVPNNKYQQPQHPMQHPSNPPMMPPVVSGSQHSQHPQQQIPLPPQTPTSSISTAPIPQPSRPVVPRLIPTKEPERPQTARSEKTETEEPEPERERERTEPCRAPILPWLSHPDDDFPTKTKASKTRRRKLAANVDVELPQNRAYQTEDVTPQAESAVESSITNEDVVSTVTARSGQVATANDRVKAKPPAEQSKAAQTPEIAAAATAASTPASTAAVSKDAVTPTQPKATKSSGRAPVVVPVLPRTSPKQTKTAPATEAPQPSQTISEVTQATAATPADAGADTNDELAAEKPADGPAPGPPKSWSSLFTRGPGGRPVGQTAQSPASGANGVSNGAGATTNGNGPLGGNTHNALADVLRSFKVGSAEKLAFIEPRGLVNTGNMCYMNSVLQVLLFCVPFYDLLDSASKSAAHSFKSDTPLLSSMMNLLQEFKVIDAATSLDQLRRRLKPEELELTGEQFKPDVVYEAIRKVPRFNSMLHGHQQDAEEFLGFLLESLHDECAQLMGASQGADSQRPVSQSSAASSAQTGSDWFEVGRKSRAAVTRTSGQSDLTSPITKIFGGQLRSEFRVPGLKDSVTLEPYQPLQLDIGAADIHNITDALKGLTRPETLHGDFNSTRGKDVTATKQVLIESLPPVLILHLKRFQFDAEGHGTVKIWKKVGYPLELEIPIEVFSRQKRSSFLADRNGLPKYKLSAVVYHHGKNASVGHYTADIRRQDDRDWIRFDDTVIRRISSEEVGEGGAEEAPSRNDSSRRDQSVSSNGPASNRFAAMGDTDSNNGDAEDGWKQVNSQANGGKKWSAVANGSSSGTSTPRGGSGSSKQAKSNVLKENKVAYLLFYSRV